MYDYKNRGVNYPRPKKFRALNMNPSATQFHHSVSAVSKSEVKSAVNHNTASFGLILTFVISALILLAFLNRSGGFFFS